MASIRFPWLARAAAAAVFAIASSAAAQGYPSKPVRLIVPFAPGSGTDVMARMIADDLRMQLGRPFIVDNRPGAQGQIAAEMAAKSPPDGYTLFVTTNTTHSANPSLFRKLPYDPVKDFQPVLLIAETPFLLVVRADHPAKSVKELVAWLKANPGQANFGYGNSTGQISGASFAKRAGVAVTAVSYKSTPPAASDLIGGQIAFMFIDTSAAQPHLKSGRLRALAITSARRSALVAEMPTMIESGIPDFDLVSWVGMFAPARTPSEVVLVLNRAIKVMVQKSEIRERLNTMGSEVHTTSPDEFGAYVKTALRSWGEKIREAGIEPE